VQALRPQVIVCLGATAARAVIGKDFKVSLQRGRFVECPYAPSVFATLHPSALLRLQDEEEKEAAFKQLVKDLSLIRKGLAQAP
jgi:uracil-DNA glycosylase